MGCNHPSPRRRIADTVRAATEPLGPSEGESAEMSSCYCQCSARMRQPPSTIKKRPPSDTEGNEDDRSDERHRASHSGARTFLMEMR